MSQLWPQLASEQGIRTDDLFIALLITSALVLILVFGLLTIYAFRYRKSNDAPRKPRSPYSNWFEIGWTGATLVIFVIIFIFQAPVYLYLFQPPANALKIFVVGKQWMFKVQHPDGQREIDALHVPVGRPIELVLASQDVIHSFYIPAFRVKRDLVPGSYETMWFTPDRVGVFPFRCAEFCGTDHAQMGGAVTVMTEPDYENWLKVNAPAETMAEQGFALFRAHGCSGCHGGNSSVHAPSFEGLYGSMVPLSDGRIVRVDEAYIRDCILLPHKNVPAGYAPVMPSFAGQLSEEDILKLIAYIKALGTGQGVVR